MKDKGTRRQIIGLVGLMLLIVGCLLFFWSKPASGPAEPETKEREARAPPSPMQEPVVYEVTSAPKRVVIPEAPPPTSVTTEPELLREEDLPLVRCSIVSDLQLPDGEVTVFEQSPAGPNRRIMLDGQIQAGALEFRSQKLTSFGTVTIPGVGKFPLDWREHACTLVVTDPTYVSGKLHPAPPPGLRVTVGGCGGFTDELGGDGTFTLNATETERCRLVVRADKVRVGEVYLTPESGSEIVLDIEISDYEAAKSSSTSQ